MPETVKLNLRLPPELHAAATQVAGVLGVSLNAFIVHAVANWTNYQTQRLRKGQPVSYGPPVSAVSEQVSEEQGEQWPQRREVPKVGANQPCPCGSGHKYKRCHGRPG